MIGAIDAAEGHHDAGVASYQLWSGPAERKRAHALADQAREGFVASADAGTKPLAELTTWLREHP